MLGLIVFINPCRAQVHIDTILTAKKLKEEFKLKEAYNLLSIYQKGHPDDLNIIWLRAQTAYWMHRNKTAETLYKQAIENNPGNYYLKLDYAKTLADVGEFDSAIVLLNSYLIYDPTNTDAWLTIAKIYYWQGNYASAYSMAKNIVVHNPENKDAIELENKILLAQSPWLKVNGEYNKDDQPLQTITPSVEAGVFLHRLADLHFSGSIPFFSADGNTSNALLFNAGIKSNFSKKKITTDINAGIVRFPFNNTISFIGNLTIEKIFVKNLILTAQAARESYFYSLSSIDTTILENNLSASIGWNDQFTVNGIAGFLLSQFPDKNTVATYYATIFSPLFKKGDLNFQFGYGYNYSNANQNKFVPKQTLSEIIATSGSDLSGIYTPYFTPDDQQVHSLIGVANYQASKKLTMGVSANYGFYATTEDPYFSVTTLGTAITGVDKEYAPEKFSPLQLGTYILWQLSKKTTIKAAYQYHHTFFYTNNYIGLTVKTSFWNEKK